MLKSKTFGAVLLAAVAVSPAAMAGDRGTNTAIGAVLGAVVGHTVGGTGGAVAGGGAVWIGIGADEPAILLLAGPHSAWAGCYPRIHRAFGVGAGRLAPLG